MKIILVVLFFSAVEMVADGSCTADSDCTDGCCVARSMLVASLNTCVKHSIEGERCAGENAVRSFSGNYMFRCPCKDELTCTPESYLNFPFEIVTARSCESGASCANNECCVADSRGSEKYCQKRLVKGERCIPGQDAIKHLGWNYLFRCPCDQGFSCIPETYVDLEFFGRIPYNHRCT